MISKIRIEGKKITIQIKRNRYKNSKSRNRKHNIQDIVESQVGCIVLCQYVGAFWEGRRGCGTLV